MLNGINRATHLINQLLTLSRLESDRLNIEKEKCDLAKLTKLIIQNYITKAEEKNLSLELKTSPRNQDFFILGNLIYLEIIIGNLIDNAIKYSYRDQKITITISQESNFVKFIIANSGDQILPQEIEKIFSNFYRVNRLENKNPNIGCGLGLAIAKKIADIHNAQISFSSKDGLNSVKLEFPSS